MDNVYDITKDSNVLSFAIHNKFAETMSKVAYSMGVQLKPFCLFAEKFQTDKNITDLMNFGGLANNTITIKQDIATFNSGKSIQDADEIKYECVKYLLNSAICYVEIPKWHTVLGERVHTYDKFLCTSNIKLLTAWMGESSTEIEMEGKYAKKLVITEEETKEGLVKLIKCNQSAKGNSLTAPRTKFYAKNMRVIPLYMLYAYQEGIYQTLRDKLIKFTFLKDNKTERTLVSTLNEEILRKYYDKEFVDMVLGSVDVKTVKQGSMVLSSKAHRGYIKVPEMGASKYDSTGTRSLNLARILSMKQVTEDEIDTQYINVDLGSVVFNFSMCLDDLAKKQPKEVYNVYKAITENKGKLPSTVPAQSLVGECMKEVNAKVGLFSTEYMRWLHMYIVSRPDLFPTYTGQKREEAYKSTEVNYTVESMDW